MSDVVSPIPATVPTVTASGLDRGLAAERDYTNGQILVIVQRLNAMDTATRVLHETVTAVPTDVDKQVGHLKELHAEKFHSVSVQFLERDERSKREALDNKTAVDAAFSAQKEAAAAQDQSNAKAIAKSEAATAETINKLSELFKSTTDALADKIDDVKGRIGSLEVLVNGINQRTRGGNETSTSARGNFIAVIAALSFLTTFAVFIAAYTIKR